MKLGFDNKKYLKIQRQAILERIGKFDGKLYLEFGGKLFDDFHASRVLPGFEADSKLQMLLGIKDKVEVVIAINANDIASNKVRGDNGITYQDDVLRLIDTYREVGLFVSSVVISFYEELTAISEFKTKLENSGIKVYKSYEINGYPRNIPVVVSEEGLGKNEYVVTERPLIVVTAPGPGSGKMAFCLSQLYHENKRGINAGYAKYETFPVWNLSLNHPVNLAYEAATIDLNDVNMIDPFHLEAYGVATVNYNRDVEAFPLLKEILTTISGSCPYKSPTDMGVNMVGFAITNEHVVEDACRREIVRRYFETKLKIYYGKLDDSALDKIELLMTNAGAAVEQRKCVKLCRETFARTNQPSMAIELNKKTLVYGHQSELLSSGAALLLNALKSLAKLDKDLLLLSPNVIAPIRDLKINHLHRSITRLRAEEVLLTLAIQAQTNPLADLVLKQLPKLRGLEAHSSHILSEVDESTFKRLGVRLTEDAVSFKKRLYTKY